MVNLDFSAKDVLLLNVLFKSVRSHVINQFVIIVALWSKECWCSEKLITFVVMFFGLLYPVAYGFGCSIKVCIDDCIDVYYSTLTFQMMCISSVLELLVTNKCF